jgi:hypothetical protein
MRNLKLVVLFVCTLAGTRAFAQAENPVCVTTTAGQCDAYNTAVSFWQDPGQSGMLDENNPACFNVCEACSVHVQFDLITPASDQVTCYVDVSQPAHNDLPARTYTLGPVGYPFATLTDLVNRPTTYGAPRCTDCPSPFPTPSPTSAPSGMWSPPAACGYAAIAPPVSESLWTRVQRFLHRLFS